MKKYHQPHTQKAQGKGVNMKNPKH